MTGVLPSIDAAKAQAKALRASLIASGQEASHSQSLELIAKSLGFRDWNTLHAKIGNAPRPPVAMGQIVEGRYLKQPFVAEVLGLTQLSDGRYSVVLHLAEAVDVVSFDSFSNFRRRITKVIGPDGRSFDRTSDGVAHLEIRL
ncbi:MAG: hypothetical protein K9G71_04325 [Rhodobacteraceae bacterium]|nr:hypothetical protein [Paracoccaceae bacterium]MCF8513295.1 hypothetical protein [Paracoccaceae bacterium]MCF8517805.1 hypothetical protein [Paracoccaceae bacterium]